MRNFARSRRVLPNANGQSPWTGHGFVSPQEPKRAASEEWEWVSSAFIFCYPLADANIFIYNCIIMLI